MSRKAPTGTASPSSSKPIIRRQRGFEPAAGLLAAQIRKAGEKRGFAESRILTHWAEIVGPDIAACCRPVKVSYGRGGMGATLTLLTTGAAAPLLQMQLPALRDRVNGCYGYNAIARISLTQTAPTGFHEGQASFTPAPQAAEAPPPDPRIRQQAHLATREVHDDGLRDALERLADNVLSKVQKEKGLSR